jgi:hypothetical protein
MYRCVSSRDRSLPLYGVQVCSLSNNLQLTTVKLTTSQLANNWVTRRSPLYTPTHTRPPTHIYIYDDVILANVRQAIIRQVGVRLASIQGTGGAPHTQQKRGWWVYTYSPRYSKYIYTPIVYLHTYTSIDICSYIYSSCSNGRQAPKITVRRKKSGSGGSTAHTHLRHTIPHLIHCRGGNEPRRGQCHFEGSLGGVACGRAKHHVALRFSADIEKC